MGLEREVPGKGSRVACVSAAPWVLWWSGGSPWREWVCDGEMIQGRVTGLTVSILDKNALW